MNPPGWVRALTGQPIHALRPGEKHHNADIFKIIRNEY